MAEQVTPDLLTVREVAEILRLHPTRVKTIAPAELPYTRVGGRGDRRYSRGDVERYIAARRVE